jgi:hypothetical protein
VLSMNLNWGFGFETVYPDQISAPEHRLFRLHINPRLDPAEVCPAGSTYSSTCTMLAIPRSFR